MLASRLKTLKNGDVVVNLTPNLFNVQNLQELITVFNELKEDKIANYLDLDTRKDVKGAVQQLVEMLQENNALITINLRNTDLSSDSLDAILLALFNNDSVKNINLSELYISENNAKTIAELLRRNKLKSIDITNIKFFGGAQTRNAVYNTIFDALKENTSLKILHMPNNFIPSSVVPSFSEFLKRNNGLRVLNIKNIKLEKDEDWKEICEGIKENNYLKELNFMFNEEKVKAYLLPALEKNPSIVHLKFIKKYFNRKEFNGIKRCLTDNKMAESGLHAIMYMLYRNRKVNGNIVTPTKPNKISYDFISLPTEIHYHIFKHYVGEEKFAKDIKQWEGYIVKKNEDLATSGFRKFVETVTGSKGRSCCAIS